MITLGCSRPCARSSLSLPLAVTGVGSCGVAGMRDDIACPTDKLLPVFLGRGGGKEKDDEKQLVLLSAN